MEKLLVEYKEQILHVLTFIYIPFIVFVIAQALVYLLGRMLEFIKSNRSRNTIAFLAMIGSYAFYFLVLNPTGTLFTRIWVTCIYASISILFYVLLGFKLYSRVDAALDKIFPDKGESIVTPPKKRRAKK